MWYAVSHFKSHFSDLNSQIPDANSLGWSRIILKRFTTLLSMYLIVSMDDSPLLMNTAPDPKKGSKYVLCSGK